MAHHEFVFFHTQWHPDKNPDNEQATKNFQKISEAYAVLSDSKKRKLYDQYGLDGVNAAEQGADPSTAGFGGFHGGPGGHMSQEDAQRIFSSFFGGADPFGGMGGGGFGGGGFGGPNIRMRAGGGDPISMMFGGMGGMGGMPGGMAGGFGNSASPFDTGSPYGARPVKRYDAIPEGTVVTLRGLVRAADRNGDRGVVRNYIRSSGRYEVELEDSDETMSIKPANLLQHVRVRVHGIESQPDLNGASGTVIAWNEHNERYNIYMTSKRKVVSLKPGNVILDSGTVGQVTGLAAKPELNGKWGTINNWVRESNRYELQLSANQIIRIKVDNVRI